MRDYLFTDYVVDALRTESTKLPLEQSVIDLGLDNRLLHAIMGVNTEINEIYDAVEDKIFMEEIDKVNLLEEVGDVLWYDAIAYSTLSLTTNPVSVPQPPFNSVENLKSQISVLRILAAEMLDHTKKVMFYGKTLDYQLVYANFENLNIACYNLISGLDGCPEQVMKTNIAKLKARYPEKFTETDAEVRDLGTERAILEKGLSHE